MSRGKKVVEAGCRQLVDAVKSDRVSVSLAEKTAKVFTEPSELAEVVAVAMASENPKKSLAESCREFGEAAAERDFEQTRGRTLDSVRKEFAKWPREWSGQILAALEQLSLEDHEKWYA